jgi:ATPase subunit of ABC transporter with duplicated ATPase domains
MVLQMLAGELRATHGNIQINPKVRIARYTQVQQQLVFCR